MSELENAAYWRNRAKEVRQAAEGLDDPNAKRIMLELAVAYERIAERVADPKGKFEA